MRDSAVGTVIGLWAEWYGVLNRQGNIVVVGSTVHTEVFWVLTAVSVHTEVFWVLTAVSVHTEVFWVLTAVSVHTEVSWVLTAVSVHTEVFWVLTAVSVHTEVFWVLTAVSVHTEVFWFLTAVSVHTEVSWVLTAFCLQIHSRMGPSRILYFLSHLLLTNSVSPLRHLYYHNYRFSFQFFVSLIIFVLLSEGGYEQPPH